MLIQYASDIHLECLEFLPKITVNADVLCVAGDIGDPFSDMYAQFLIMLSTIFKKVFIITGNNDYYMMKNKIPHTMEETHTQINFLIQDHELDNVSFLNNSCEEYNGYVFVGSTLWSDISSIPKSDTSHRIKFKRIPDMTYEKYNMLHQESIQYIKNITTTYNNNKIIVITHHLPSHKLMKLSRNTLTSINNDKYYASDCEKLFVKPIVAWIYGHTHISGIDNINNIMFVSNPRCNAVKHNTINFLTIDV